MPKRILPIMGQTFGMLTDLGDDSQHPKWLWQCSCGSSPKLITATDVRTGRTTSCGCLTGASMADGNRTHGMTNTPEFSVWCSMRKRCLDKNNASYESYGGRGITVCDSWLHSFENFFHDMGKRPTKEHSLDRKDNMLGYSPDNCRWATRSEQGRNTRSNRLLTIDGVTLTLADWSDISEISRRSIEERLAKGWSEKRAVMEPRCASNRSNANLITIDGETKCLNHWVALSPASKGAIVARLKKGWPAKKAVMTPPHS